MNKKHFSILALVAVLMLAFAGSAFAAAKTYTWQGKDGANWGEKGNWVENEVPDNPTAGNECVVVFPNSTKTVSITDDYTCSAIVFDSGTAQIVLDIVDNKTLTVASDLVTVNNKVLSDTPTFDVKGNAQITGKGTLTLSPGTDAWIRVFAGYTLDINVKTISNTAELATIWKTEKGTVAFSAGQANAFDAAMTAFNIQDGELSVTRVDHLNDDANRVVFDTNDVQGRVATFTAAWTNSQKFSVQSKITANTDGTINIPDAGATLVLDTATRVVDATVKGLTITKDGAGTLTAAFTGTFGAAAAANAPALDIVGGTAGSTANGAFAEGPPNVGLVSVNINDGTSFWLAKTVRQAIAVLSGGPNGTLNPLEGARLDISGTSTYPGYITGAGSIAINNGATVRVTGINNDYTGDTFVAIASRVIINHEKNLGGTKLGRVYLAPAPGVVTPATVTAYARLEVADGRSFVLPNEVYIGDDTPGTHARQSGEAIITVPINVILNIANNITYNYNTLVKFGEGELILSSLGYDHIGNGSFLVSGPASGGANSTSLHILNGKVRIENEKAAALGDIVVDAGGFPAGRPILSIRNGLKMSNAIYFTNQSTFQTELADANLSEGTSVASAVEVGKVFFDATYIEGNAIWNGNGIVYNRVSFNELAARTVTKGQDFQLMKATSYTNYDAPKVEPVEWDGQVKAPFDPYFSTVYLYFKATHNIDVPTLGAANPSAVKVDTAYTVTIPVTSTTDLVPTSATVFGLAGATAGVSGKNVVINGPAIATSGDVPFRVSITTLGDAPDTLGYEGYRDYVLSVGDGVTPPVPTKSLVGTETVSDPKPTRGKEITFTVGDWVYTDENGNTTTYAWNDSSIIYGIPGGQVVEITGPATLVTQDLPVSNVITVKVNDDAANGAVITVKVNAECNGTAGTATQTATVSAPTGGSSSSSSCDAGFGAMALLALAGGALVLRKKD